MLEPRDLISHEMLRESCLSILSSDLSLELGAKLAYLPAIYCSSCIEGQWVGGKPRIKGFSAVGGCMLLFLLRVLLFTLNHIFCNGVFRFHCCSWGEYICFSYGSLLRFVFDGLHSSSYCLV